MVETWVYVMVPHDIDEMVVDRPEMLKGAQGPVDFAVKLRDRFIAMGKLPSEVPAIIDEARPDTVPDNLQPVSGEAEFL